MLPSHRSFLTVNVKGPAVNFTCGADVMSGRSLPFERFVRVLKPTRSLHDFVCALKREHRLVRREAEEYAADRLVMRLPPLGLLRGGMHVAEAALERAVVEDRCRAGAVVESVDHLARLVNRPGRGEAYHRVFLQAQLTGLADRFPDFGKTAQQEGARRTQPSFDLRQLRLDDLVFAHPLAGA